MTQVDDVEDEVEVGNDDVPSRDSALQSRNIESHIKELFDIIEDSGVESSFAQLQNVEAKEFVAAFNAFVKMKLDNKPRLDELQNLLLAIGNFLRENKLNLLKGNELPPFGWKATLEKGGHQVYSISHNGIVQRNGMQILMPVVDEAETCLSSHTAFPPGEVSYVSHPVIQPKIDKLSQDITLTVELKPHGVMFRNRIITYADCIKVSKRMQVSLPKMSLARPM